MSTPRRRTPIAPTEPNPQSDVEIVIDEDTPVTVHGTAKDGSTLTYEAKVKKRETNNDGEDDFDEDFGESEITEPLAKIPQTQLYQMFNDVREASSFDGEPFVAIITRLQDFMNDGYNVPCSTITDFPPLQFTANDLLTFIASIQKANNNSGGRFTIKVCRMDASPLLRIVHHSRYSSTDVPIGCAMVAVPNPIKDLSTTTSTAQSESDKLAQILATMHQQNQQMQSQILQALNAPKPKSTLEDAMERKILNDMLNPPVPQTDVFQNSMAQMMLMPAMAEGFSRKMFPPEPLPPPEPTTLDTIMKVIEMPMVQNITQNAVDSVLGMVEQAQAAKFAAANKTVIVSAASDMDSQTVEQLPEVESDEEPSDMQVLIEDIIKELESANPLDATNEMIKSLTAEYPDAVEQIIGICKGFKFERVVPMLIEQTKNLVPFPFDPYLDHEQIQATQTIVWNEKGGAMLKRLEEFYTYMKTLDS